MSTDLRRGVTLSGQRKFGRMDPVSETSAVGRLLGVFFFQAEDGIRDLTVTGVQTCALPISDLSYAEVMRYRRELRDDAEFQGHLKRCLVDIPYIFPEAAEVYAVVRAMKPGVIVETGVASGLSSAHILRALAANGTGTLHSIDLPNVQDGSVLPQGRTPGWIVPDSLRGSWRWQMGGAGSPLPELLTALGPGAQ